jgi:c-di-GMP-binding flagellar brake protein YcgR
MTVTVVTKDNEKYRGYFAHASDDFSGGGIILTLAKSITDENNGNSSFNTILFKGDDISRIMFNQDFLK